MVQWAKENAAASEVNLGQIRWIVDDCIKFVHREIRRGNKYDIVILDLQATAEVLKVKFGILRTAFTIL